MPDTESVLISSPGSYESGAEKAVVLLSSGLDSTVSLALAIKAYRVVMAISVAYGQRAAKKELAASAKIAAHYQLPHRIIHLPWMEELLPIALKTSADTEDVSGDPMAVQTVWVPNRNGVLLNIAASLAEAAQAGVVVFGANAEEGADFPDNTDEYRAAVNQSLHYSTLTHVRVETPVGQWDKAKIIAEGIRLKAPLEMIWSCYEAGEQHCGKCASCLRLKRAISQSPVIIPFENR